MNQFFKKTALFLAVTMVASLILTSCGPKGVLDVDSGKTLSDFHMTVQNNEAPIKGGMLRYAIVSDSPFAGIFANMFSEDAITSQISDFFLEGLLSTDADRVYSNDGAATYSYDIEKATFTITIKPEYKNKLKWHDGEPVTMDDLLFAYEVICHPDYDGVRYDSTFKMIVGTEEYNSGQVNTISGIMVSDDKQTITFQFKKDEFPPSILSAGIWTIPEPRHYYEGIPVSQMRSHEKSRSKAIGFGPFKLVNVVEGESARLIKYDDYYKGPAKIDGITAEVVATDLFPVAMEEGRFDIGLFATGYYSDYMDPVNYQYLGSISRAYGYVGFKLGSWVEDTENGSGNNVYDSNVKMADVNLRKAIAYAHDAESVGKELYNDLRFRATTIINPFHGGYQDLALKGYTYNPEKAMQILDAAGYVDVDSDGFRENPDGSKLIINYASMSGGEIGETLAQMALQDWRAVGLNVRLATGGTIEFNLFYDLVMADDPGIDIYAGAWSVAYDPNPSGVWGVDAFFNMTRYTSPTIQKTLDNISSSKAWDEAFRIEQYSLFQRYFEEEIPAFPTLWRIDLTAVNNRVKNYSVDPEAKDVWLYVQLTNDIPYKK